MLREEKEKQDSETVEKYRERLKRKRKGYSQTATGYSYTDRKSRAQAVGDCCMKVLEAVEAVRRQHTLIDGTLSFMITDQKVKDPTGIKGHRYEVGYQVLADEPAYTEEEIRNEVEELAKKLKIETAELFAKPEETEDKDGKDH